MTGSIRPRHRPAGRQFVLLVLAVLAGVLGMHALGPGGMPAAERPAAIEMSHDATGARAPEPAAAVQAPAVQAPVAMPAPEEMPSQPSAHTSVAAHAPAAAQAPMARPAPAASVLPVSAPPVSAPPVSAPALAQAGDACAHTDGGPGHLAHADRTCAAAGIASAYAPPALDAALSGAPDAGRGPAAAPASTVWGRAPPDLSELQLLRI